MGICRGQIPGFPTGAEVRSRVDFCLSSGQYWRVLILCFIPVYGELTGAIPYAVNSEVSGAAIAHNIVASLSIVVALAGTSIFDVTPVPPVGFLFFCGAVTSE